MADAMCRGCGWQRYRLRSSMGTRSTSENTKQSYAYSFSASTFWLLSLRTSLMVSLQHLSSPITTLNTTLNTCRDGRGWRRAAWLRCAEPAAGASDGGRGVGGGVALVVRGVEPHGDPWQQQKRLNFLRTDLKNLLSLLCFLGGATGAGCCTVELLLLESSQGAGCCTVELLLLESSQGAGCCTVELLLLGSSQGAGCCTVELLLGWSWLSW
ncbi:LOW QUALITY PROTEIN: hypothetical protein CRUP_035398 [Coryphaenoides rupestris]|nr:LOW QUALITY PROTEIN: hypothetical protein CRUP_035398 [Coryphaenoides rupestris]